MKGACLASLKQRKAFYWREKAFIAPKTAPEKILKKSPTTTKREHEEKKAETGAS